MSQIAGLSRRQQGWVDIGWQGIVLQVPEDWYPAALGVERKSGYLRVQNAEGSAVEVKWFNPRTVDMERELDKYRRTLERASRKRRQEFEWKGKPKVPGRESRGDKNRRFFAWSSDAHALGVLWYCRTCGRVVIAQVVTPLTRDGTGLASQILNSMEDHGEDGRDLWALYGLQARVPEGWVLDKHQLMAGYTMLQFRSQDRLLRTERWALASIALKEATLLQFVADKSRKFWRDYALQGKEAPWGQHAGARFAGRIRKPTRRAAGLLLALIRRAPAHEITVRAWHCNVDNKIYVVHAIHARGEDETLQSTLESVVCH